MYIVYPRSDQISTGSTVLFVRLPMSKIYYSRMTWVGYSFRNESNTVVLN